MVGTPTRWALHDWVAAFGLFAVTAAVILWQNAHVAVLWDLSYVLDTATRIAQGQLPYRDFPFAHAPLTFLIQAAIIRLTGRVFFHHVLYAAIIGGLGTVLTWRIALRSLADRVDKAWFVSVVLAAPLAVLGIYCILPMPSYDCDCAFAVLADLYLLQRLEQTSPKLRAFIAGVSLCIPLFFKQNIGLPFLVATIALLAATVAIAILSRENNEMRNPWPGIISTTFAGIAAGLITAVVLIHFSVGLGNYYHWTIQFAAQRRLPGLQLMLGVYHDSQLLWTLPCVAFGLFLLRRETSIAGRSSALSRVSKSRPGAPGGNDRWGQMLGLCLLAAPFIYTLFTLVIYDDADERGDSLLALWPMLLILAAFLALYELTPSRFRKHTALRSLLPVAILAAIHGTLMSQQLWGSTYAIWPLLILLIAAMLAYVRIFVRTMAIVISVTLLVCGAFYVMSEERLSYAQLPEEPAQHSAFPALKGMSTPGPYLADFDELLRYAEANIPAGDGVILVPGEDPFYFATGRTPQFPVLLFDPATDPLSPQQVVDEAMSRHIRWLIVKRNLQLNTNPTPDREAMLKLLLAKFAQVAHLRAYDVYEVKSEQ